MKRVYVVYEGAAGEMLASLDGRTPLQMARMHFASRVAVQGSVGGLDPGEGAPPWRPESVLAGCSGVSPAEAAAWRRGPVEAAAAGRAWPEPVCFVYRGDFCTVDEGILRESQVLGLTVGETRELAQALDEGLAGSGVRVLCTGPGTVAVGFCDAEVSYPEGEAPFAHVGREVAAADPGRVRLPWSQAFLDRAAEILAAHPVNAIRVDLRENPANAVWLWGGGPPPTASAEMGGVMMTRSVLACGVAALRGMRVIEPPDPWAVPREADRVLVPVPELVQALRSDDLLLVHIAAPRPGGGYGSGVDKVRALDHLDQRLLGPLLDVLDAYRPFRIVLAADAAVSTETMQPQRIASPVVLAGDGIAADAASRWEEQTCLAGRLGRMNLQDFLATARCD